MTNNLFEQLIFSEAPEDEPVPSDTGPPDIPDDQPPELDVGGEDQPPELADDAGDDFGMDGVDDQVGEDGEGEAPVEISEKISTAMNYRLYQRFLTLSNTVSGQLTTIKSNSDLVHSTSPKAMAVIEPLGKLGENIRLYLINNFLDSNYSQNLLFYNKCLNLLKLLNDIFSSELGKAKPESR